MLICPHKNGNKPTLFKHMYGTHSPLDIQTHSSNDPGVVVYRAVFQWTNLCETDWGCASIASFINWVFYICILSLDTLLIFTHSFTSSSFLHLLHKNYSTMPTNVVSVYLRFLHLGPTKTKSPIFSHSPISLLRLNSHRPPLARFAPISCP
jgi:hypothetical protein